MLHYKQILFYVGGDTVRFRSKVDLWYHGFAWCFAIITAWQFWACIVDYTFGGMVTAVLFLAVFLLFVLPVYMNTYYIFEREGLHIQSGLFINLVIPYADITACRATRNPAWFTPALSLDRFSVEYKTSRGKRMILLSPEDKKLFLSQLLLRNPWIDINP